jgi:hypothetical protein
MHGALNFVSFALSVMTPLSTVAQLEGGCAPDGSGVNDAAPEQAVSMMASAPAASASGRRETAEIKV